MSIVPSDAAPVVPSDAAPQKRRRRAPVLRAGVIDESIVAGSPEDSYCPCTNQNGTVDSPVWFFFRMRKTERALAHPTCNRCYCQIPGCKFDGGVAQRTSSGGTKALWRHLAKHGWKVTTDDEKAAVVAEQVERVVGWRPATTPRQIRPHRSPGESWLRRLVIGARRRPRSSRTHGLRGWVPNSPTSLVPAWCCQRASSVTSTLRGQQRWSFVICAPRPWAKGWALHLSSLRI